MAKLKTLTKLLKKVGGKKSKDKFVGQKYMTDNPKNMPYQMTPEYKTFLRNQGRKERAREIKKGAAVGATTGGATAAGLAELGRREKNKKPQKKKNVGMATKWQRKWG